MKKTMIAIAFTMLGLVGTSYAGAPAVGVTTVRATAAAVGAGPGTAVAAGATSNIPPVQVEAQFSQQFEQATDVRWEEGTTFYKATFENWGRTLFAFYSDNGELMGVATNLSSPTLPTALKAQIKRYYAGYWITDLFSYHSQAEGGFVITLENADKIVVLKAVGDGGWNVYRTTVKG